MGDIAKREDCDVKLKVGSWLGRAFKMVLSIGFLQEQVKILFYLSFELFSFFSSSLL